MRCSVGLVFCLLLCGAVAQAAPVVIRAEQRSTLIRRDSGHGICATLVHVRDPAQGAAFPDLDVALSTLNGAPRNLVVDGRFSDLFSVADWRNRDNDAQGDFAVNQMFPFSDDPRAVPRGNGRNFAARVRGYVNVVRPGIFTIGIHADDGARLNIAGMRITEPDVNQQIADRYIRQIRYGAAGLYPVELIYYQNGSAAVLELSSVDGAEPEVFAPGPLDTSKFKLIPREQLYSARAGKVNTCVECSQDPECPRGNYCAHDWPGSIPDGLCAPCLVPNACGDACIRCPSDKPVCVQGGCVQCAEDCDCMVGQRCDVRTGTCNAGKRCTADADCSAPEVCDVGTRICVPLFQCTVDVECPCGYSCDVARGRCRREPPSCKDRPCPTGFSCDPKDLICKPSEAVYVGGCSTVGGKAAPPWGILAVVLLLFLGWRVRGRFTLGILLILSLLPTLARAQLRANAQTFHPAFGPENIITIEGTRTPGHLRPMALLLLEYSHRPLRLIDRATSDTLADTVKGILAAHVMGGIGLSRWLSVGIDLPVVLYQGFDTRTPVEDVAQAPSTLGIGDLRLIGKVRFLDNQQGGVGLAFVPQITFPSADGIALRGDDAFGIEPRFALDYRSRGGVIVALNLGFLGRTKNQIVRQMEVGSQVRYGIGGYVPLPAGFGVAAEVAGGTSVQSVPGGLLYSPLEGHVAGRWRHRSGLELLLGTGGGFTNAVGSPQARVFAGVGYLPLPGAAVPQKPRPARGTLEVVKSGTGSGRVKAEPAGIDCGPDCIGTYPIDTLVQMRATPEPTSIFGGWSGPCSGSGSCEVMIHETTQVGVLFSLRQEQRFALTVDKAGDGTGEVRVEPNILVCGSVCSARVPAGQEVRVVAKGDPDSYFTGWEGPCSGLVPCSFQIRADTVLRAHFSKTRLPQSGNRIHFETAKWSIDIDSYHLLDDVVTILKQYPRMHLRIEGHTDIRPFRRPGGNLMLSRNRARSVLDYLVAHGISASRLTSEGYGETCPVAPNNTPDGLAQNRRTEFIIVDPLSQPQPIVGCQTGTSQRK